MPEDQVLDASNPPSDLAEYDAWIAAQAPKETPDKPAVADAKPAPAAKTAPTSEAEEDQEHDDADETPAKKSGFARRIDKLNQKIGAREARIAELEKLQGANAPPAIEKPAAAVEPAGKPKEQDFETYAEFVEHLTDWKADQRDLKRAAEAATQRAAESKKSQDAAWSTRVTEFAEEHDDFDALMEATKVSISPPMIDAIRDSEHGPAIAYHLAKNPDEAKRIAALTPVAAIRAIGKIEAAIDGAETVTPEPKPRVTKAPPPPKTVKAAAESAEPDPSDYAAWEQHRNAQLGASHRR